MSERILATLDGNEAVTSTAFRVNEVCAIYPITPASTMGELADEWSAKSQRNIWSTIPDVVELQSEAGAAAAAHGSLQAGALTTTFTASQGLLLMIPSLYKIAGELSSFCMHVAARTLATHALSIFGDHSDVMACRQIGMALLASGSVQEAHDMACIGHAATLEARVPFIHFFDGFRTSHEVAKIELLSDADLAHMMNDELIAAHRGRALTPDKPVLRGTAQNPDAFFQAREAINGVYAACPGIVQATMDRFGELTGRHYRLFDYVGHEKAERVLVIMGSGAEVAHEAIDYLIGKGEKIGVLKVRLYRPFSVADFAAALPSTVRAIAVLDRTKEPGAVGEPLYQDVVSALHEAHDQGLTTFKRLPRITGGRYGLSSKEFTPAMVKAVFDEVKAEGPKNHFTVGIMDDVTHTSLDVDPDFDTEGDDVFKAVFFGLGADGTVGANKNSLKIVGEETSDFAQGYFVYDSKKSGAVTVSHLRTSPRQIRSSYLIEEAEFVACHSFPLLERQEIVEKAKPGGVFLLNAPYGPDEVWDKLPREVQETIIEKKLRFYVIDAYRVAKEVKLGARINTIMQTCFFDIAAVIDGELAKTRIKEAIEKTYGKLGTQIIERNFAAVDEALNHLHEVKVPGAATNEHGRPPVVSEEAPDFVQKVTAMMIAGKGDLLPVSAFPIDGTWPVATSQWEKRNIAQEIPIWDESICTQCNLCVFVCPHSAIRAKVVEESALASAPEGFTSVNGKASELRGGGLKYVLQVAPEDCTGCTLCVEMCPAKNKAEPRRKAINMEPQAPIREREREKYTFFLDLPEVDRSIFKKVDVRTSQYAQPLFEYSGACSGCGETPYLKLLTQLFGDRALLGNATGCTSIYSGNLPTTPYTVNRDGRGPAWSNSLFEDAAEFSFGFRLAVDASAKQARELLRGLSGRLGDGLAAGLVDDVAGDDESIATAREQVVALRDKLAGIDTPEARRLELLADYLVPKSVWAIGGDGWAYDIGYGGLDHVLSMDRNINLLVLDTEVYSNTGGQQSKATPLGAAAKFATAGKSIAKKDLGMEAMSFGHAYVARVAFAARPAQTVQAFIEAESYPGPSMIIAYANCIAHGYDMARAQEQHKLAVACGTWPLYRYDPRRVAEGKPPLSLDSKPPTESIRDYMKGQARFRMVEQIDAERYQELQSAAEREVTRRFAMYQHMAGMTVPHDEGGEQEE